MLFFIILYVNVYNNSITIVENVKPYESLMLQARSVYVFLLDRSGRRKRRDQMPIDACVCAKLRQS